MAISPVRPRVPLPAVAFDPRAVLRMEDREVHALTDEQLKDVARSLPVSELIPLRARLTDEQVIAASPSTSVGWSKLEETAPKLAVLLGRDYRRVASTIAEAHAAARVKLEPFDGTYWSLTSVDAVEAQRKWQKGGVDVDVHVKKGRGDETMVRRTDVVHVDDHLRVTR